MNSSLLGIHAGKNALLNNNTFALVKIDSIRMNTFFYFFLSECYTLFTLPSALNYRHYCERHFSRTTLPLDS